MALRGAMTPITSLEQFKQIKNGVIRELSCFLCGVNYFEI
jgi:hypothetical protein